MNKPKFTPGPWRLRHGSESKIENIAGRKVATADLQDMQPYSPWGQMRGRIAATPERKANAALISAAPEMYEALADIAENCGNRGCSETCAEAGCKICEILKKARGES